MSQRLISPSSAVSMHSLSRGGILGFLEWTADSGELLQRRSGGIQMQIQNRCLRSSYHGVWSKGIHPRHPPREFPLGLRAPVLGMGTAQIPGNEPFPFLVGERILLSPVRCLGSCSFQSHPAEAGQGSPHPAAQTPLRFFNLSFSE